MLSSWVWFEQTMEVSKQNITSYYICNKTIDKGGAVWALDSAILWYAWAQQKIERFYIWVW